MPRPSIQQSMQQAFANFPFADYIIPDCGSYENLAATVSKHLEPGNSILDFGAGACDKTALLAARGYRCSACDDLQDDWHLRDNNREKIIAYARMQGIDLRLTDGGVIPFPAASFDMVMANDVIEHLHESPRSLVGTLIELIKPNGYLLISVPNAVNIRKRLNVARGKTNLPDFATYYWYPGQWRGHIREYVKDDLRQLAQFASLEIVELRGCHHMLQKVPLLLRPVYKTVTALFPAWRDSWILVARKPANWQPVQLRPGPDGADLT